MASSINPISSQVPRLAEEMKKYGKSYDYKIYPDAPHAFNSDVRRGSLPSRGGEGCLGPDV